MSEQDDQGFYERAIAVVGMSGRFPGAGDLAGYWRMLAEGREAVTELSDEELRRAGTPDALLANPSYVKMASLLDGVDRFDAGFFGYSAREAEILDPQQRLFLEHTWEALEDAGCDPARYDGLIGVYAGVAWNTYLLSNLTTHRELFDGGGAFQVFITNDKDFMPTRAAYKMNLKGPAMIVQTSCSTSLVAIHLACLSLSSYECDLALAGGVTVKVPQHQGYYYQEGSLASPDGHCRAFDADAAGTIFGSGVGMVALKRLSEALEDGDPIHAVIRGSAINNDGTDKVSYTAPSVSGQAEVIAAAQAVAGVAPETIGYVECHGTGTSLGDPIEVTALSKVFREATDERRFCAIGSVKTNVGHLDAAAGVAGFIKTVLALENRQIPPSLHYRRPNPAIDFETSPFYVATAAEPFEPRPGAPRRAGVSSFGVGGTNAHVILEEAPEAEPSTLPERAWQLLPLSARSTKALDHAAARLAGFLEAHPELDDPARFADLAYTLQTGRAVFRHRRVLVVRDRQDALALLSSSPDAGRDARFADDEEPRQRPVVFLFSGQGSQYPHMGRELYESEPVFRREVDRAAELLAPRLGLDLRTVLYPEGEVTDEHHRRLEQTALAQPALFVVEHALARLFASWGVEPQAMLGHSIGEFVAACLSGVLALEDALALVAERGRLMQELPAGAMLAVPLAEADLVPLLPDGVSVAVLNEPERSVASGPEEAIAVLEAALTERGVGSRRLHTSHAFHSGMMEPAVAPFIEAVRKTARRAPEIPYLSNVTGDWTTPEDAADPAYWGRHLRGTVRFADGVAKLLSDPARVLLEIGPGRTLATLAGRHPARAGQPVVSSLPHPQDNTPAAAAALLALGRLWTAGIEVDWRRLHGLADEESGQRRLKLSLPTYPFERQRYWIEPLGTDSAERTTAAARSATGTVTKQPNPGDWLYLPSWRRAPSPQPKPGAERAERFLVLSDENGLADALVERITGGGRQAVQVAAEEMGEPGELLARLTEEGFTPDALVDARSFGVSDPEAVWEKGFWSLLSLVQAAGEHASGPLDLTVVSDGLDRLSPAESLVPEKATMLGLLTVLPQEQPQISCRAIDLLPPASPAVVAAAAGRVLAEIDAAGSDERVLLRGAERWVPDYEPVRVPAEASVPLREEGVYVLTGPVAGNVHALARWLAREYRARLLLLRPTGDPSDEAVFDERREGLVQLGGQARVVSLDLADEEAVYRALSAAREEWGALDGVVHAAGTVGERTFRVLKETGREEAGWHFAPKVAATHALDRALTRATGGEPLDFAVLLSSLATVVGGLAYGAYTAANLYLDAFARVRRTEEGAVPWRSLGWDVWQFEDEREQITEMRGDLADLAMSAREGEAAFAAALALSDSDLLLVSTADLAARAADRRERIERLRGRLAGTAQPGAQGAAHPRPTLGTPFAAPETELHERIATVWRRTLGFEEIGLDDNFFELGGDSFVAVQVMDRLKQELGVDLPVAQLYQGLTVRALAEALEKQEEKADERQAQLEERRQVMDRRKDFLERRRAQRRGA